MTGVELKKLDISRIYKNYGVRRQKLRWYVGPPKTPVERQQQLLDLLKERLLRLHNDGYELLQIDEAVFSPKNITSVAWAPTG